MSKKIIFFSLLLGSLFAKGALFYDVNKSFEHNCKEGLVVPVLPPTFLRPPPSEWKTLLGYPVASMIGVPACAWMTGKGIERAAQLGFDVLTYKTIRSKVHPSYPYPNIACVDVSRQLLPEDLNTVFYVIDNPTPAHYIALSNSFGNACLDEEWVKRDIAYARQSLKDGQILIVSVYGTGGNMREVMSDFIAVAYMAYVSGAQVIELNFSCPNIGGTLLYKNADHVACITQAVSCAIPIPVIIKVGIFDSPDQMRCILKRAAEAGAKGVCGINSVPIAVCTRTNEPFFGSGREISGLSGAPIKNLALDFIRAARIIVCEEQLDMVLLATGGITTASDFKEFLNAGADVALCATGLLSNPYIGLDYQGS